MLKLFAALFGRTESVLLAAILVTAIVFSLLSPYFFTLSTLVNLVEAYSVTTIFAAGAFVVLVSGGIDVSFIATAAASQYLAAYLIAQVGCPAAPALALAAILGAALGCINVLLTYYLRIVSIIVTIATSSIYYALLIYFTNAEEIYNLPDWWSGRITFLRLATASGVVKITLPIVVMVAVVLLTQYLMAWTRMGRQSLRAWRQSGGRKSSWRRRASGSVACLRLSRVSCSRLRIRPGRACPPGRSDSYGRAGVECARCRYFGERQSGWWRWVRWRRCACRSLSRHAPKRP